MYKRQVGYIQITEFNDATVAQFQQAINDMQSIGAQSLILDLRSNGGGSVEAMARMADLLLPEGVIEMCIRDSRNTLVYRLEKIKKVNGLDLRKFDHAIIFKVALMVKKYLTSNPVKY